ncbi:MAG: hypothetical protein ACXWC8_13935 [Limisphaerales bacterium]
MSERTPYTIGFNCGHRSPALEFEMKAKISFGEKVYQNIHQQWRLDVPICANTAVDQVEWLRSIFDSHAKVQFNSTIQRYVDQALEEENEATATAKKPVTASAFSPELEGQQSIQATPTAQLTLPLPLDAVAGEAKQPEHAGPEGDSIPQLTQDSP